MSETRARRRIRLAVESRGYQLVRLDWEPWYNAGEKSGIGGGWYGEMDRHVRANMHPSNDIMGLSVDETVAHIDHFVDAPEPCDCPNPDDFWLTSQTPVFRHQPGCKWRLRYWLSWWPR